AGQRLARRGERDAPTLARDQLAAQVSPEGGHGGGDGGLRNDQLGGSGAHRAGAGERPKGAKLTERHFIRSLSILTEVSIVLADSSTYPCGHARPRLR